MSIQCDEAPAGAITYAELDAARAAGFDAAMYIAARVNDAAHAEVFATMAHVLPAGADAQTHQVGAVHTSIEKRVPLWVVVGAVLAPCALPIMLAVPYTMAIVHRPILGLAVLGAVVVIGGLVIGILKFAEHRDGVDARRTDGGSKSDPHFAP
jgi:hypothetical protein